MIYSPFLTNSTLWCNGAGVASAVSSMAKETSGGSPEIRGIFVLSAVELPGLVPAKSLAEVWVKPVLWNQAWEGRSVIDTWYFLATTSNVILILPLPSSIPPSPCPFHLVGAYLLHWMLTCIWHSPFRHIYASVHACSTGARLTKIMLLVYLLLVICVICEDYNFQKGSCVSL